MTRRRLQKVVSDDEDSPKRIVSSTSSPPKPVKRLDPFSTSDSLDSDYKRSKLTPFHLEKLSRYKDNYVILETQIMRNSMNACVDAAVCIAELGGKEGDRLHEAVNNLEEGLRELIDLSASISSSKQAVARVHSLASQSTEPIDLVDTFTTEKSRFYEVYNSKNSFEKYANTAEYSDFKRGIWDVYHPGQPLPPVSQWFTSAKIVAENAAASNRDDEDVVIAQEIQSLNCPLTLNILQHPMRSLSCPHVYSRDAIYQLIKQGGETCSCPVPGCSAQLTTERLREDRMMERRVREELRGRENRRISALTVADEGVLVDEKVGLKLE